MEKFQIGKFLHESIDIVNIYRSQTGNSFELLQHLMTIITEGRPTLITGDFNACFIENYNNTLIQGLLSLGFNQLVHWRDTHTRSTHWSSLLTWSNQKSKCSSRKIQSILLWSWWYLHSAYKPFLKSKEE